MRFSIHTINRPSSTGPDSTGHHPATSESTKASISETCRVGCWLKDPKPGCHPPSATQWPPSQTRAVDWNGRGRPTSGCLVECSFFQVVEGHRRKWCRNGGGPASQQARKTASRYFRHHRRCQEIPNSDHLKLRLATHV